MQRVVPTAVPVVACEGQRGQCGIADLDDGRRPRGVAFGSDAQARWRRGGDGKLLMCRCWNCRESPGILWLPSESDGSVRRGRRAVTTLLVLARARVVLGRRELFGLRCLSAAVLVGGAARATWSGAPSVPCPLRLLTGVPCPLCGMTTGVTATLAGDLSAAAAANPFSLVVVLLAAGLLSTAAISIARRRPPRPDASLAVPLPLLAAAGLVSWIWQLHRFGFLSLL